MAMLSLEQHKLVSDAVAQAELATSGEIVPVLAEASDGYSDIALFYCAALAFTAMSAFALFPLPFMEAWDRFSGGWGTQWTTGETASMTIALGLIAFVLTWLVLLVPAIRFALVPGPIKSARVHSHAIRHFKVGAERRTHGRTGVLLYLSMREHRAEIVADQPIAERVDAQVWGDALASVVFIPPSRRATTPFDGAMRSVSRRWSGSPDPS